MEVFYTDKAKIFECKIQVEGADIDDTKARLVLRFENNRNMIFFGDVDSDGTCQIQVPALKELKSNKGSAVLEVISDSTFFEPWESDFEIKTLKKVTVEVKSSEKPTLVEKRNIETKPTVTITKSEVRELTNKELSNKLLNKFKK